MNPLDSSFEVEAMPHLESIYRTARRLTRDAANAEDVVQEVYLQAWKSYDRYEQGTNCRAWLFKILFHVTRQHARRSLRERARLVFSDETVLAAAAGPFVPDVLSDSAILSALDGTPQPYRSVVVLVDVEGFSYREAADALGIPIGTIMSRLSRGRRALREMLGEVARDYGVAGDERRAFVRAS